MDKLVCTYCGQEKEEISFMIGVSLKPEWCIHEETGKVSCPNCHPKAVAEALAVIDGL